MIGNMHCPECEVGWWVPFTKKRDPKAAKCWNCGKDGIEGAISFFVTIGAPSSPYASRPGLSDE